MKKHSNFRLMFGAAAVALFLVATHAHSAPGDLYVSDSSGTIFKFTPKGAKSTFVDGFTGRTGLAFDRTGNLFVVESDSGTISKFAPDGGRSTFASGLSYSSGAIAFDGTGKLFVTESMGDIGTISKFTPAGTKSTFVNGNFSDLAFDSRGNLFAAVVQVNGGIVWFTPDKTGHTFSFSGSGGMAFDTAGNFFVADFDKVIKYTPDRTETVFASGLAQPFGLAFDANGNLFVSEYSSGKILKFAPDGSKTTFASGLNQPSFLAFEPVTEKLRNLSARGLVASGDNVLIGGFIVGGSALANNAVVVRAIGPSLAGRGVTKPLPDPVLELSRRQRRDYRF